MAKRALVLFAHGARDPRWAEPFQRLQQIIRDQQPQTVVELAFLELMSPRLPELVQRLVEGEGEGGCTDITVVPVFFGQGGHVLRDLPVLIEQLRTAYPAIALRAVPAVGEDADVLNAIACYCISALGIDQGS